MTHPTSSDPPVEPGPSSGSTGASSSRGAGRPTFPCGLCGRTFGGYRAYCDHSVFGSCLDAKALRRKGLRYHDGIWVRPDPTGPQQRSLLGPGRPKKARPPVIPSAPESGGAPTTDATSAGTEPEQLSASFGGAS